MDLAAREMQHVRMALDEMSAGRGYDAHDGLTEEMPQTAQAVELAALELQHVDMALDQERDGREDVAHMDCKPIDAPLQDGHVEGTAVVAAEFAIQTLSGGSAVVGNIAKPQRGRPPLSAQAKQRMLNSGRIRRSFVQNNACGRRRLTLRRDSVLSTR